MDMGKDNITYSECLKFVLGQSRILHKLIYSYLLSKLNYSHILIFQERYFYADRNNQYAHKKPFTQKITLALRRMKKKVNSVLNNWYSLFKGKYICGMF